MAATAVISRGTLSMALLSKTRSNKSVNQITLRRRWPSIRLSAAPPPTAANINRKLVWNERNEQDVHWIVSMSLDGVSEQNLFSFYVQTLDQVVGSEEEAQERIYMVSLGRHHGFGFVGDLETANKLKCKPINQIEIFGKRISNGAVKDGKHWIVVMTLEHVEFESEQQQLNLYVQTLAQFVGSDEAKKKIYMVSFAPYFGFGFEGDLETAKKLRFSKKNVKICTKDPDYEFRSKKSPYETRRSINAETTEFIRSSQSLSCVESHWTPPLVVSNIGIELLGEEEDSNVRGKVDGLHWLVFLSMACYSFESEQELFNFYVELVADVVGSEEEAKRRIYLVSMGRQFGFGVELDLLSKEKLSVYDVEYITGDPRHGTRDRFLSTVFSIRLGI